MTIEVLMSAAFWALLLAPATVPVCTYSLNVACLRLSTQEWCDAPVPQPELSQGLAYGIAMSVLPISAAGVCFPIFQLLTWLNIYHSTPLSELLATSTALCIAGVAYASLLAGLLSITLEQALAIQQRVLGPLMMIFLPFFGATVLR